MKIILLGLLMFMSKEAQLQTQKQLLNIAYTKKSNKNLRLFLNRWSEASTGVKNKINENASDTLKALNELYRVHYQSQQGDLNSRLNYNNPNDPATIYLVLHDAIKYSVIDTIVLCEQEADCQYQLPDYEAFYKIINEGVKVQKIIQPFVPELKLMKIKLLLLTTSYGNIINDFLQLKENSNIDQPDYYTEPDRVRFLHTYLPFQKAHWGNYWNYMSYPMLDNIIFDRSLAHALIKYSNASSSGVAYYRKELGRWIMINTKTLLTQ